MDAAGRPRELRPRIGAAAANVRRAAVSLAIGASIVWGLCGLVPAALGFERHVVMRNSMTGTIDRGSIVFTEQVPVAELGVGDVITFRPAAGGYAGELLAHRIVAENRHRGETSFRTQGDANPSRDPGPLVLDGPTQARTVFSVPYAGYVTSALSSPWVRTAVIGATVLVVALLVLARWRARPVPRR